MGANSEIKRLSSDLKDEVLVLFPTSKSKMSIVAKLLMSPWLKRASSMEGARGGEDRDCEGGDRGGGDRLVHPGKVYRELVAVKWDHRRKRFISFRWRKRTYPVDGVLSSWVVEKGWWDPEREVSRVYVRLTSRGGVYDLFYDRIRQEWFLDGIAD